MFPGASSRSSLSYPVLTIVDFLQGQHSMDNLVLHLEKILAEYENASEGIADDEDSSAGSQEDPADFDDRYYDSNFSADDRWFILCSRPMGSVTLIPTLLSLAAVCCSAIGNNICTRCLHATSLCLLLAQVSHLLRFFFQARSSFEKSSMGHST